MIILKTFTIKTSLLLVSSFVPYSSNLHTCNIVLVSVVLAS